MSRLKISNRAVDAVIDLLADDSKFIAENDYLVAVTWCLNRVGEDGDPGPGLAFFERRELPQLAHVAWLYDTDRFAIYNGMPLEYVAFFDGCILDFLRGGEFGRRNFRFVRPDGNLAPLPPPQKHGP